MEPPTTRLGTQLELFGCLKRLTLSRPFDLNHESVSAWAWGIRPYGVSAGRLINDTLSKFDIEFFRREVEEECDDGRQCSRAVWNAPRTASHPGS